MVIPYFRRLRRSGSLPRLSRPSCRELGACDGSEIVSILFEMTLRV